MFLGLSLAISQFRGSGGDAAADYIAAVAAAGGNLDYTNETGKTQTEVENAIKTFVSDLKTAGLWNLLYWILPVLGKTPTAHALDLRQFETTNYTNYLNFRGYPTAWHGAMRHDSRGIEGDGSTAYGETYIAPGAFSESNPSLTAKSAGFYCNRKQSLSATERHEFGTIDYLNFFGFSSVRSNADQESVLNFYAESGDTASNTNRDGFFVVCENQNAGETIGYRNGTPYLAGAAAGSQPLTQVYILARQSAFGVPELYHDGGFSLFFIGDAIPDSKQAAFNTAVQNFMTSTGRDYSTVNTLYSTYGFTSSNTPSVTNPSASANKTFNLRDVSCTRTTSQRVLTEGALSESVYGSAGSGPSLTGKTYSVVDPTGEAYVSTAGVVKRVTDTTATILTDTAQADRYTSVPLSLTGGVNTDVYNSYLTGTAGKDLNELFDAVITGFVEADQPFFSVLNHGSFIYQWNTNNPIIGGIGYYPTCISVYNSSAAGKKGGILVTPRIVIFANHYNPGFGPNMGILFVTAGNVTVQRTIINGTQLGSTDIWIGLLDSDVPATITPAKIWPENFKQILPSISGQAIPVFWSDQDKNFIAADLQLDAVVQPDSFFPDSPSWSFSCKYPTDSQRLVFSEALIEFDSGSPCMAMMSSGDFIAIGTATFGGAGGGTSIWQYRNEINAQIAAWGVNQTLTPTTELAAYTQYATTDQYGYFFGNDNELIVFTAATTTGFIAVQPQGESVTIFPTSSVVDLATTATTVAFWSCTSAISSVPSGTITDMDCGGDDQLGGITKIDVSKLTGLVNLDCQQQLTTQISTDVLLPYGSTSLVSVNMFASFGVTFYELRDLPALTTFNIAGCALTGFQITDCPSLSSLNVSSNSLSANALNVIYTALPDRTGLSAGSIVASSNTGYATSTTTIATAKNWVVT